MEEIVKFVFGLLTPVIKFINNFVNMPFSKKHITGDHYYLWRDKILKGHVLLANTFGVGTNILNVSALKHGALYYGKGLKSAIEIRISESEDIELKDRLIKLLNDYSIDDEICYVLESIYEGVVPTSLVKFLTTKDVVVCSQPLVSNFIEIMDSAAEEAVDDLGLAYDYRFTENDNRRYCFEVVGRAYERAGYYHVVRRVYKLLGIKLYSTFMSSSFTDGNWKVIIDSRT